MSVLEAKFYEEIHWLFELTQKYERGEPLALTVKLGEEVGEFDETVLKHTGYLRHKEVKEDPMHEAADIINVLIGCLTVLYPEKTPFELTEELYEAICEKGEKYERILRNS